MKYRGVELVNCGPPSRRGPYSRFPSGKYLGQRVEDVIRRDPRYFMWAVKEWLDVSPQQALLFELQTGGGEIPSQYVKSFPDNPSDERSPEDFFKSSKDREAYWRNLDLSIPNYDFDPSGAPSWWREFKQKSQNIDSIWERYFLYQQYVDKEWEISRKMFEDEYRTSQSKERKGTQ